MARIFLSHSSKDPESTQLLFEVQAQLKGRHDVFLAEEPGGKIGPGDRWRTRILEELSCCRGAVVLFSKHSPRSEWQQYEAAVLSFRQQTEGIRVVPAWIVDSQESMTDEARRTNALEGMRTHGFGPAGLTEAQIELLDPADDDMRSAALERIEAAFGALASVPETTFERWVLDVHTLVAEAKEPYLQLAADKLGIHSDERAPAHLARRIALSLLCSPRDQTYEGLAQLAPGLPAHFGHLRKRVIAAWVALDAATRLHEVSCCTAMTGRSAAIDASVPELAYHYARRAVGGQPVGIARVPQVTAETDDRVNRVLQKLAGPLQVGSTNPELVEEVLKDEADTIFLIFGCPAEDEEGYEIGAPEVDVELVEALRDRCGAATFLFLARRDFEAILPLGPGGPVRIEPALGDEREIVKWIARVKRIGDQA